MEVEARATAEQGPRWGIVHAQMVELAFHAGPASAISRRLCARPSWQKARKQTVSSNRIPWWPVLRYAS